MSNKSKYLYNKRKARTRFRLKNSCTKILDFLYLGVTQIYMRQIIDDEKQSTFSIF